MAHQRSGHDLGGGRDDHEHDAAQRVVGWCWYRSDHWCDRCGVHGEGLAVSRPGLGRVLVLCGHDRLGSDPLAACLLPPRRLRLPKERGALVSCQEEGCLRGVREHAGETAARWASHAGKADLLAEVEGFGHANERDIRVLLPFLFVGRRRDGRHVSLVRRLEKHRVGWVDRLVSRQHGEQGHLLGFVGRRPSPRLVQVHHRAAAPG
mmetsp:Transcript_94642/g.289519  ORF Transcript_94642/g.289519 Transcript_94642/m.289519 type:complete len:207 (-) Transcript_94642:1019-1639(-)